MMCAAKPAVLAQVNIAGVMFAGTCAKSRMIAARGHRASLGGFLNRLD
jgi:hypothetical protein